MIAIAGVAPLLIAIAWNGLAGQRDLQEQLRQLRQSMQINPVDDAFAACCELLHDAGRTGWDVVRLYGPVGLWDYSPEKDKWLDELAGSLQVSGNKYGAHVKKLRCVYALPPDQESFGAYAKDRLSKFANTESTEVHYWPPDKRAAPTPDRRQPITPDGKPVPMTAPGLGMVIFEQYQQHRVCVVFGIADSSANDVGQTVTGGFVIEGEDIGRRVRDWFDSKPFDLTRNHVLRGRDPEDPTRTIDMQQKLDDIVRWYYS